MSPLGRTALALGALIVVSHTPRSAEGQIAVSATATGAQPNATIRLDGIRERLGGIWGGGTLTVRFSYLSLVAEGLRGTLTPIDGTPGIDREGGLASITASVSPVEWGGIEGGYEFRRFVSAAGTQEWGIFTVGGFLTLPLGDPAIWGHVRGGYMPRVRVPGVGNPQLGLLGEVGLTVTPRHTPVILTAHYRIQRFDFPGGALARLEQFDTIAVGIGLHVGAARNATEVRR